MKQSCNFCPKRDLAQHRPSLHVDIDQVFDSHTLPAIGAFSVEFEDVDDTDSIGPRIENTFDAIEYGIALENNIKSQDFASGTGNITTPITPSTSEGGAE